MRLGCAFAWQGHGTLLGCLCDVLLAGCKVPRVEALPADFSACSASTHVLPAKLRCASLPPSILPRPPPRQVYAFSSENWGRPPAEVSFLLGLVERVLSNDVAQLAAAGIRLRFIGEHGRLPTSLRRQIHRRAAAEGVAGCGVVECSWQLAASCMHVSLVAEHQVGQQVASAGGSSLGWPCCQAGPVLPSSLPAALSWQPPTTATCTSPSRCRTAGGRWASAGACSGLMRRATCAACHPRIGARCRSPHAPSVAAWGWLHTHALPATAPHSMLTPLLQDLTLAVQELVRQAAAGQLSPSSVTPDAIAAQLATRQLPAEWREPDLVVRTSGEQRLSNFMCWEAAYAGGCTALGHAQPRLVQVHADPHAEQAQQAARQCRNPNSSAPCLQYPLCAELYFAAVPWPDFGEAELAAALRDYAGRERRFGGRRPGSSPPAAHSACSSSNGGSSGGSGGGRSGSVGGSGYVPPRRTLGGESR